MFNITRLEDNREALMSYAADRLVGRSTTAGLTGAAIAKGFAESALFISSLLSTKEWSKLIPVSSQLFSDRPIPIIIASVVNKSVSRQFDELADDIKDEVPDLSWDEANKVAMDLIGNSVNADAVTAGYKEVVRGRVSTEELQAADDCLKKLASRCRQSVDDRLDVIDLISASVDTMNKSDISIGNLGDKKPWILSGFEMLCVLLMSRDISADVVGRYGLADSDRLLDIYKSKPRTIDYNKFVFCWMLGQDARDKRDIKRATRRLGDLMPSLITIITTKKSI